jgi:hypothetical protein
MTKKLLAASANPRLRRCYHARRRAVQAEPVHTEWPMWGGTPDRNMVSTHEGHSHDLGRQVAQEHPLGRRARVADLRQPGGGRRHRVRRDEQRGDVRPGDQGRQGNPAGVPRVGRRVPLAGRARQAAAGPGQRLAVPGRSARRPSSRTASSTTCRTAARSWRSMPRASATAGTRGRTPTRSSRARSTPTSSGSSTRWKRSATSRTTSRTRRRSPMKT